MRDRLIELLLDHTDYALNTSEEKHFVDSTTIGEVADTILADGWMRPPVRVGNKVYIVAEVSKKVIEATVIGVWMYEDNVSIITDYGTIHHNSIGKSVFLTREEAEQALKEGGKE